MPDPTKPHRLHLGLLLSALLLAAVLAASCGRGAGGGAEKALDLEQGTWVQERISALESFYGFTPEGRRFLGELDLRQKMGQPGWFGSFGFDGWTGVGEAKPESITHEIGHAYWGAFDVSGRPDLDWSGADLDDPSQALGQFHRDLEAFMAQPPDLYEPLRDRLRALPGVLLGESESLYHFGEADLVHTTGGNLRLLPPILRKYFDQYLRPGEFGSWYDALGWYQGLNREAARAAGAYFGLTHFPLANYRDLQPSGETSLPADVRPTADREEVQRLEDFARQFDMATGVEKVDGETLSTDPLFFRGYLWDKLELHRRHPEALSNLEGELPMAGSLADVMSVFAGLAGRPVGEQADILETRLEEPFFSNFWPLVSGDVLMELVQRGVLPKDNEPVERVTDQGIALLARAAEQARLVLELGRENIAEGAVGLGAALETALDGNRAEVGLLVELMWAGDRQLANDLGRELAPSVVLRLLEEASGPLRQLVGPEDLLPLLGITPEATADGLVQGVRRLMNGTSRNFRIDQPYFSQVYALIAERAGSNPREALDVVRRTGLLMEDLLSEHPVQGLAMLRSDLDLAAKLLSEAKGHGRTPQRLLHSIVGLDPGLGARLLVRLDALAPSEARAALVQFAYDSFRKSRLPSLAVSPLRDGEFLLALAAQQGENWVVERMAAAIAGVQQQVERGDAPTDFLQAYLDTLEEAASLLPVDDAETLRRMARSAFSETGVPL